MNERDFLLKHSDKKIELLPGVKNILVYAHPKVPNTFYYGKPWLLIVSNVVAEQRNGGPWCSIYRIVSYSIKSSAMYVGNKNDVLWGNTKYYDFFLVTDEQRRFFNKELSRYGYKYVSSLKKVIERK